ncbi:amino acid adenylation domain-containing protein, partial [Flavitalea sp. BT771]
MERSIAVIGFSARLPQADSVMQFFKNLRSAMDSVRPVDLRRIKNTGLAVDKDYQVFGYLDDIDQFDFSFFDISPGEAQNMDPRQRMLLETVYHAFENAGYSPAFFNGSDTSLFMADVNLDYHRLAVVRDATLVAGNMNAMTAGRIARYFNLRGKALAIDSTCSSSLVALEEACNDLILGNSKHALVCGARLSLFLPEKEHDQHYFDVMAPDGKAKSFSAQANGLAGGEAVACILLKPLQAALDDNDIIHAVIRGTAVNSDGALSASLTAPDAVAQSEVIRKAWSKAGIDPEDIGFIEAHGTGTKIGDPIEIEGLNTAFRAYTPRKGFCALSAVKTNIGHTDTVAGLAGLIKTILSLKYKVLFPSLHFDRPNPLIDFSNSAVYVNTAFRDWEVAEGKKRIAGVSSFGLMGTNCHAVLEEAPVRETVLHAVEEQLPVVLSGGSQVSLERNILALRDHLLAHPGLSMTDIAYTMATGRKHFAYRHAVVASSTDGLLNGLSTTALRGRPAGVTRNIFVYSGITVQAPLVDHFRACHPLFDQAFRECMALTEMRNGPFNAFAFQYAFHRLLGSVGVRSNYLVGNGIGKCVIAVVKGDASLQDGLQKALAFDDTAAPGDIASRVAKLIDMETGRQMVNFLEMGPVGDISTALRECRTESSPYRVVTLDEDPAGAFHRYIAEAYMAGSDIDWNQYFPVNACRIELPGYQFDRKRCWIGEPAPFRLEYQYTPAWTLYAPAGPTSAPTDECILVMADTHGVADIVIDRLRAAGNRCIRVSYGVGFEMPDDDAYIINDRLEAHYSCLENMLRQKGIELTGVIRLHSSTDDVYASCFSQVFLAKALAGRLQRRIKFLNVTFNGQRVTDGDRLSIPDSVSEAFFKSLLSAYPGAVIGSVDFNTDTDTIDDIAAYILYQYNDKDDLRFFAYRSGRRYVKQLTAVPPDSLPAYHFPPDAVYLVTGGGTGMGMQLCRTIARQSRGHFIIIGRTAVGEKEKWEELLLNSRDEGLKERIRDLQYLENAGSSVEYRSADVADEPAMRAIATSMAAEYGRITGIIHGAGNLPKAADAAAGHRTIEESMAVLRPKIEGVKNLEKLFGILKPDFFILSSSLNAWVPQKDSWEYTVANAYLDAFANDCFHEKGMRMLSVNWPVWAGTGMGRDTSKTSYNKRAGILKAITAAEGAEVFQHLAGFKGPNMVVANALFRQSSNPYFLVDDGGGTGSGVSTETLMRDETAGMGPREAYSVTAPDQVLLYVIDVWKEVLRHANISATDDFFEIGGHSLNGSRVLVRLNEMFGLSMDFETLLEYGQAGQLAAYIHAQCNPTAEESGLTIQPAPIRSSYEMSDSQRRIWVLQHIGKETNAYNITRAYRIKGAVDISGFSESYDLVVRRHQALRTTFIEAEGTWRQVIHPEGGAAGASASDGGATGKLSLLDLSHESNAEMLATTRLREEGAWMFHLDKGPLVRAQLIKLSDKEFIFLFSMHHIISDFWSCEVFVNDLVRIYHAPAGRRKDILPPLPIQYKDFSVWQHRELAAGTLAASRTYWKEQLMNAPVVNLPLDFSRPAVKTYHGQTFRHFFDQEATAALDLLSRQQQASLFMVLVSLIDVLIYKYTGQSDIVIGTPVAGRPLPELEHQIGCYVNTIVLRSRFPKDAKFTDLLRSVRETCLKAYANQTYPFDRLIEDLDPVKDAGRNPLFDICVVLQNTDFNGADGFAIDGFEIEGIALEDHTSKFDLNFTFQRHAGGLQLNIEYNTDLFAAARIVQLAGHLDRIVAATVARPEIDISEINFLYPEELQALLRQEQAAYPSGLTPIDLFETNAALAPDKIALTCNTVQLSYHRLNQWANQLASYLHDKHAIGVGDFVGLLVDRSEWSVVAMFGIMKSGAIYVPLDPLYPPERIRYIIQDAGIRTCIAEDEGMIETFGLDRDSTIFLRQEWDDIAACPSYNPARTIGPADPAYVIYTSGSTGMPKGVVVDHGNLTRLFVNDQFPFLFKDTDTWTLFHSMCFDFSIWEIFGALLYGGRLVVADKDTVQNPSLFLRLLEREGVTVLNQIPTLFGNLLQAIGERKDCRLQLRYVIFGGEALNPGKLKDFHYRWPDVELVNMYGITEVTVHATYKKITGKEIAEGISNIGQAIPTTSIYIMDEEHRMLPAGVPGEIVVGGKGVAKGYLYKPELTAGRFIQNPYDPADRLYCSGDVGMRLWNGDIQYLGRKDHQVKVRGFRIETGEIETALLRTSGVREAHVVAKREANDDYSLIAFISGTSDVRPIRAEIMAILPPYMIPAYFVVLDEFPLTPSGKVDKKALLLNMQLQAYAGPEYQAARDNLEQELVECWKEVLSRDDVGIHANFFELGGDSIKAIRLSMAINKRIATDAVDVRTLFLHPTVAAVADQIRYAGENAQAQAGGKDSITASIEQLKTSLLSDPTLAQRLPAGWEDVYPMSDIELGMVFHNMSDATSAIYCDQFFFQVEDPTYDHALFVQAFHQLIDKHEILRTSFHLNEFAIPVQIVHRTAAMRKDIPFEDISRLSRQEQQQRIRQDLKEDKDTPFDIVSPGLWRMKVYALSGYEQGILWTDHHAIIDGWSNASLLTELSNVYFRLKSDAAYKVTRLRASYKDFIIDQLRFQQVPEITRYWQNELLDYERADFPFNKSLPSAGDQKEFGRRNTPFGLELSRMIRAYAVRHGVTIKEVCLTAFLYLLKYTNNANDVTIGLVASGRPEVEDGDKILGCFLNTVPFRHKFDKASSPAATVAAISQKVKQLKSYDKLTLPGILKAIGEEVTMQNPIYDIIFNYIEFHIMGEIHEHTKINRSGVYFYEIVNTNFNFIVDGYKEDIFLIIAYLDGLFTAAEIDDLVLYYQRILRCIVDEKPVLSGADVTGGGQVVALADVSAKTQPAFPALAVHELFSLQAERTPDATAIVYAGRRLSYATLEDVSDRLAAYLRDVSGVKPNDLSAVLLDRSDWMIIAILAALKAGAAYVPIDPSLPSQRIDHMLKDGNIKVVLTTSELMFSVLEYFNGQIFAMDLQLDGLPQPASKYRVPACEDQVAYVVYTSGSTGKPKGVMVEHASLRNLCSWHIRTFETHADSRATLYAGVGFDASVWELWPYLLSGATLFPIEEPLRLDMVAFAAFLRKEAITHVFLPTPVYEQMVRQQLPLDKEMWILTGGDTLRTFHPEHKIVNNYGPSENTVVATSCRLTAAAAAPIPIGKPIDNVDVYILSEELDILPRGTIGEICLSGKGLAKGYLGLPGLTAEKFVPHPFKEGQRLYRTGDQGRWLPGDTIEFKGRRDDQLKINGYRIELGEIETRIRDYDAVKDAVVLVKQTAEGDKELTGYVVTDTPDILPGLKAFLQASLPQYMQPSGFILLEEALPLTPNGKLDKKYLAELGSVETSSGATTIGPRNPIEEQLAALWQDKLGHGDIGIFDNFFAIGGDSIKAIRLVVDINKTFGSSLEIKDIFEHQTIAGLAGCLEIPVVATVPVRADLLQGSPSINKLREEITGDPTLSRLLPSGWEDLFSVSDIQKGMLYHSQLHAASGVFKDYFLYQIEDESFDLDIFRNAFALLVDKHPMLRTSFNTGDFSEPVQIVHTGGSFVIDMDITDMRMRDEEEQRKAMLAFVARYHQPSFDLANPGLWRLAIARLDEHDYCILWVVHHAIIDGWSNSSLMTELTNVYYRLKEDPAFRPGLLKASYKDFIIDQQRHKISEKTRNFWASEMEGYKRTGLPFNKQSAMLESDKVTRRFTIDLDEGLAHAVAGFAGRQEVNVKIVYFSAFLYLIRSIVNTEEVVIGLVSNSRPAVEDGDKIVGCFLNAIPFRWDFSRATAPAGLVHSISEKLALLTAYDKLSFFEIIKSIGEEASGVNPVYDILFNFVDFHIYRGVHANTKSKLPLVDSFYENTNTFFDFTIIKSGDDIRVSISYATDLYSEKELQRAAGYFIRILTSFTMYEQRTLSVDAVMDEKEKEKLLTLHESGARRWDNDDTVLQLFEEQAARYPAAVAVRSGGEGMSYGELDRRSNRVAHALLGRGLRREELVCLCVERGFEMIVGILGIMKAGGAYVPVDPDYPEERINYMVSDSEARYVLRQEDVRLMWGDGMADGPVGVKVGSGELAYVMYTSGSTGRPKGVMVEHRGVSNRMQWGQRYFALGPGDAVLQKTTYCFDVSVWELLGP